MNSSVDVNALIQSVLQDLDPGTIVIMKLFDDPTVDDNLNPNADDPFETNNKRVGGGGGGSGGSSDAILMDNIFQS